MNKTQIMNWITLVLAQHINSTFLYLGIEFHDTLKESLPCWVGHIEMLFAQKPVSIALKELAEPNKGYAIHERTFKSELLCPVHKENFATAVIKSHFD